MATSKIAGKNTVLERGEKKKPHGEHTVQLKGHTRAMEPKMTGAKGMKRGGKVKK